MKIKKEPIRTCVYTKIKAYKKDMIRLVKNEDNVYVVDKNKKAQKRGIYIYPCEKIIDVIFKNKKYNILEDEKKKIIEMIKAGGMYE